MTDAAAIQKDVIGLLRQWSVRPEEITPDAAIYQDLHIAGDDAYEIIMEIRALYGTDFTALHMPDYFPNESEALWYYWAARLGFPDKKRPRLTVAHMVAVIERGAWFAP